MKDGKPTCGYDRLKIKYAALEKQYKEEVCEHKALEDKYEEQSKTISLQSKTISELTAKKEAAENDVKYFKNANKEYWRAMGWLRRWLYERKNCK